MNDLIQYLWFHNLHYVCQRVLSILYHVLLINGKIDIKNPIFCTFAMTNCTFRLFSNNQIDGYDYIKDIQNLN